MSGHCVSNQFVSILEAIVTTSSSSLSLTVRSCITSVIAFDGALLGTSLLVEGWSMGGLILFTSFIQLIDKAFLTMFYHVVSALVCFRACKTVIPGA